MKKSYSVSYKEAGVDITAGYRAVDLLKTHMAGTKTPGVLSGLGGFGGLFELDTAGMQRPVLVSATDGVGTKLKLAFLLDKHDTVGIDCVAMCVNDVICTGARPLFFLDYIALGKLVPEKVASIVAGIAAGCREAQAALIGGETAEMPGFYREDEYDLAGFALGIVDKGRLVKGEEAEEGDVIIALPSSGIHANGFSLVRKVFAVGERSLDIYYADLASSLGEALLTPTKIYVAPILSLLAQVKVKGLAHITGGGLYENIPRSLPAGLSARIALKRLQVPPIFSILAAEGGIPQRDMFNTFNMGVGMTVIVSPQDVEPALDILREEGAHVLGEVVAGDEGVIIA